MKITRNVSCVYCLGNSYECINNIRDELCKRVQGAVSKKKKKKSSTGLTSLEFWALMVLFIWAKQQERKFHKKKKNKKTFGLSYMRKAHY